MRDSHRRRCEAKNKRERERQEMYGISNAKWRTHFDQLFFSVSLCTLRGWELIQLGIHLIGWMGCLYSRSIPIVFFSVLVGGFRQINKEREREMLAFQFMLEFMYDLQLKWKWDRMRPILFTYLLFLLTGGEIMAFIGRCLIEYSVVLEFVLFILYSLRTIHSMIILFY